jgi:hypothetical protein
MITFKQGYSQEGTEAEVHTVDEKMKGRVLRDQEGHLEVYTNEVIENGEVIVVVKDGSNSTYSGVVKDEVLIVGPVSLKEHSDDQG